MSIYDNNPALPSNSKQDGPIPNVPATQRYAAAEWNALVTKIQQTVDAIMGNVANWVSFSTNASLPSPASGKNFVANDGVKLVASLNGDGYRRVLPEYFNVMDLKYGVKGDALQVSDGVMSMSGHDLTSASNLFVPSVVGKLAVVLGAGTAGAALVTTVATYVSAGHVTLTAAAATGVSGTIVVWGTDDTAALQACALDCQNNAVVMIGPSSIQSKTAPTMLFPGGRRYLINGTLSSYPVSFEGWGDPIIYQADQINPVILYSSGKVNVSHLTLRGGGVGIKVATGNVGHCQLTIEQCEIADQVLQCLEVDNNSGSTSLFVDHTTLSQPAGIAGGKLAKFATGDHIDFIDCTFYASYGDHSFELTNSVISFEHINATPNDLTGKAWFHVKNGTTGTRLSVNDFRMGGEGGGQMGVLWDDTWKLGTQLRVHNSPFFCPNHNIEFVGGLPASLDLDKSQGDGTGIYFSPSLPAGSYRVFKAGISCTLDVGIDKLIFLNGELGINVAVESDPTTLTAALTANSIRGKSYAAPADIQRVIVPAPDVENTYLAGNGIPVNAGTVGGHVQVNAGSTPGQFTFQYTNVTGIKSGLNTLLLLLNPTNGPVTYDVVVADAFCTFAAVVGRRWVAVPFVMDPASPITVGVTAHGGPGINVDAPQVFAIVSGMVDPPEGPNLVFYDSVIPAVGRWLQGQKCINSAPGAVERWVCTASGRFAAAWLPTTLYHVGDYAQNDTGPVKCYRCITQGTSAGSGGPTGTGSNITDGTAHWAFVENNPTLTAHNL